MLVGLVNWTLTVFVWLKHESLVLAVCELDTYGVCLVDSVCMSPYVTYKMNMILFLYDCISES